MSTTTTTADWWRTTPNPPCEPWCTAKHESNEFSASAGLLCFRTLLHSDVGRVDVQRTKHISLDGDSLQTERPTVWLEMPYNSVLDPEQSQRLGDALVRAAEFLEMTTASEGVQPAPGIRDALLHSPTTADPEAEAREIRCTPGRVSGS